MFRWLSGQYVRLLQRHKYPVQIVSGGLLWFTGDVLSQGVEYVWGRAGDGVASLRPDCQVERDAGFLDVLDLARLKKMTLYGLFFSAPIYAFWYSFLDRMALRVLSRSGRGRAVVGKGGGGADALVPGQQRPVVTPGFFSTSWPSSWLVSQIHGNRGIYNTLAEKLRLAASRVGAGPSKSPETTFVWKMVAFKLVADIIIFDPVYLAFFFSVTGLLEGKGLAQIEEKLRSSFAGTYLIDMAVWFPIQLLNFRFVPVQYQALFCQVCNVGWNAFLSFILHSSTFFPPGSSSSSPSLGLGLSSSDSSSSTSSTSPASSSSL